MPQAHEAIPNELEFLRNKYKMFNKLPNIIFKTPPNNHKLSKQKQSFLEKLLSYPLGVTKVV